MNTNTVAWNKFSVGSSHPAQVKMDHIQDSDPCNKTNCMLTRAVNDILLAAHGEKFKVRSTNHGLILDLKGRRITFVFDTGTAKRIYTYDRAFKKTRSRKAAWTTVGKGFNAKLMVESNVPIPTFPPMPQEIKDKLAKAKTARRHLEKVMGIPQGLRPTRQGAARALSM